MLKTLYARFLLWLIRPALTQWVDNGGVDKRARTAVLNDLHPNGSIAKRLRAFHQADDSIAVRMAAHPKFKAILTSHKRSSPASVEHAVENSSPKITIKNDSESMLVSVSRIDDGILAHAQDAD